MDQFKNEGRYTVQANEEYEPGSKKRVLKNLLSIKRKREMDKIEFEALEGALSQLITEYDSNHCFNANDICKIHKIWLGKIYPWSGEYRQVNMCKSGFPFAAANLIPKLMIELEKNLLANYTPCCNYTLEMIAKPIAIVHTELLLIHPFRDGNGRLARLLAILMGLQANLPPFDFRNIKGKMKQKYIHAVQAGLDRNYQYMEKIFQEIIKRTIKLNKINVGQ